MIQEFIDMDTQKIRYISESSNTSGYSSPAASPSASLQAEFSNLNLPSASPQPQPAVQSRQQHMSSPSMNYNTLHSNATLHYNFMNFNNLGMGSTAGAAMVTLPPQQPHLQQFGATPHHMVSNTRGLGHGSNMHVKTEYTAMLRILEQPVEKFRFRYKSEMHGTHGSLNGANSKRTPKTFPEVELCNFNGRAIIRCSLFQTNLESPHSHQLVVRKDDTDICDPHDLEVTPERGYVAQFQNMGIIHTAKKFIVEELLKKKMDRLRFELGRDELSTKERQELQKETEREAKEMNLNQVRLCFEAFKVEEDNTWTRIAQPVFTNPINNRKSAQTGELRICRLSIATGTVSGGDDLILLVEKVSKKNIKVRFYELDEDDGLVWEAFGKFRESDVHHQYAIVCQTPPYKNKDIDKAVEVNIELVRPSDDERSYPVTFRYKPRDVVVSRKRRRTCSSANSSSSGSGSSLNSFELPKPVREQAVHMQVDEQTMQGSHYAPTISEEFGKDEELKKLIGSAEFRQQVDSAELAKLCSPLFFDQLGNMTEFLDPKQHPSMGCIQTDGPSNVSTTGMRTLMDHRKLMVLNSILNTPIDGHLNPHLQHIMQIYDKLRTNKYTDEIFNNAAKEVADIFSDHAEKNDVGETILHELAAHNNNKLMFKTCHVLSFFKLTSLLNTALNAHGESALHTACLHNRIYYIRPLLGLGANPNLQDRCGNTALHIAVREQHKKCIESFFNMNGLSLNLSLKNDEGLTVLHLAIRRNDCDATRKLLEHDNSAALVPNTKDINNALHMAVLQSNMELVKVITNARNEHEFLCTRNAAGRTALDLAKELRSKVGDAIVEHLAALIKDDDDEDRLVIKEEDISCSSSDEESSSLPEVTQSQEVIQIKEELDEADEKLSKETPQGRSLKEILNTGETFVKLAESLSVAEKWKRLAEACNMQHLLCIWNNATDFLNYIRTKVDYNVFAAALENVDPITLQILQRT